MRPDQAITSDLVTLGSAEHVRRLARDIEALLFVSSVPLSERFIAAKLKVSVELIRRALTEISKFYRSRGITLVAKRYGIEFRASKNCKPIIERYLLPPADTLPKAELTTLALIAYLQPCKITIFRQLGVRGARSAVAWLITAGFVLLTSENGEERLGTSSLFLESFGISHISDLPPIRLSQNSIPLSMAGALANKIVDANPA